MRKYAKLKEFQVGKLKSDMKYCSRLPLTQLEIPRAVITEDQGVIVDVHDVEDPGYEVEFFDASGKIVDFLTLHEHEIEPA
jgi:hypothetical protein